ncbi:MAG: RNase adapter RapZ [Candidatus Symbiodolus clandestinus]
MRLVMVSGHSGAGKSVVLHVLEDMGYYCVDNLPISLLTAFVKLLANQGASVAVSLDVRNLPATLEALENSLQGLPCEIHPWFLFLQTDQGTLLQRYSDTRRRHPLAHRHNTLEAAIAEEQILLVPLRAKADLVIDTSQLSVHQLAGRIRDNLQDQSSTELLLILQSFGFKYGVPREIDYLFDVRFLPNPYWERPLRLLTGDDPAVVAFLQTQTLVTTYIQQTTDYLTQWLPVMEQQHRLYVTVAIGCTGGRHRSVYVVNQLAEHFRQAGRRVQVQHRALEYAPHSL